MFCPKFTEGSFPEYRRQVCNLPTHFHIILRRRVHKALSPFLLQTCLMWRLYIDRALPVFPREIYDIFFNCKWVASRWQLYNTHLHTNNTQNDKKNNT
jgi:hypothetical protein